MNAVDKARQELKSEMAQMKPVEYSQAIPLLKVL